MRRAIWEFSEKEKVHRCGILLGVMSQFRVDPWTDTEILGSAKGDSFQVEFQWNTILLQRIIIEPDFLSLWNMTLFQLFVTAIWIL